MPIADIAPLPALIAPAGLGETMVNAGGVPLRVFTYRPSGCRIAGLLVVFAGIERNADTYRDDAVPLARRLCLAVAAPLFDAARFPTAAYQRGGLVDRGVVLPPSRWTVGLVGPLVGALRRANHLEAAPYCLIGHSAGAQFLGRIAAYAPGAPARIVIADPSTYVLADPDERAPYGFGGLAGGGAMLRRYLAAPITILLGQRDTGDRNLVENDQAMRQGATRLERGERTFAAARAYAQAKGFAFGWRLIEVPGIAHDARAIFATDQAVDALGLADGARGR